MVPKPGEALPLPTSPDTNNDLLQQQYRQQILEQLEETEDVLDVLVRLVAWIEVGCLAGAICC